MKRTIWPMSRKFVLFLINQRSMPSYTSDHVGKDLSRCLLCFFLLSVYISTSCVCWKHCNNTKNKTEQTSYSILDPISNQWREDMHTHTFFLFILSCALLCFWCCVDATQNRTRPFCRRGKIYTDVHSLLFTSFLRLLLHIFSAHVSPCYIVVVVIYFFVGLPKRRAKVGGCGAQK